MCEAISRGPRYMNSDGVIDIRSVLRIDPKGDGGHVVHHAPGELFLYGPQVDLSTGVPLGVKRIYTTV